MQKKFIKSEFLFYRLNAKHWPDRSCLDKLRAKSERKSKRTRQAQVLVRGGTLLGLKQGSTQNSFAPKGVGV